jgi:hypothetical protein
MPLITCDEHGKSPGGVLCQHIANGSAKVAVRIPAPGEEGIDYLFEQCLTHPWDLQLGDIVTACVWCARNKTAGMTVIDLEQFSKKEEL